MSSHFQFAALSGFGKKNTPHKEDYGPKIGYRLGQMIASGERAKKSARNKRLGISVSGSYSSNDTNMDLTVAKNSHYKYTSDVYPVFHRSIRAESNSYMNQISYIIPHKEPKTNYLMFSPLLRNSTLPSTASLGSFLSNLHQHPKATDQLSQIGRAHV